MEQISLIAKELSLPEKDIYSIQEYLEYNEWGIAFEQLCSAIEQENIVINSIQYKEISQLGTMMKMNHTLWENLKTRD